MSSFGAIISFLPSWLVSNSIFPYGTLYEFAGVNSCLQSLFWQEFRQIDGNFVNLPCINKIYGPRECKWILGVSLTYGKCQFDGNFCFFNFTIFFLFVVLFSLEAGFPDLAAAYSSR